MGHRKLMRVPLDFTWELNKVWNGYLNPYHPHGCNACDSSGYNIETKKISDDFYDFNKKGTRWGDNITQDEVDALVKEGRLRNFGDNPTSEQINLASKNIIIHDAINRMILVETRAKRLGVYGECQWCNGEGVIFDSEEHRNLYENWKEEEPPIGNGYQLWETCSEGSPVSPVFESAENLADWCEKNATTFGSYKTSKENWMKMFLENSLSYGTLFVVNPGKYMGAAIDCLD